MTLHSKAFEGMNILIFGDSPMWSMQVEQAIATAAPTLELSLTSFEEYESAYQFCKKHRNVGLIIISEENKSVSFEKIFRELSKHSKNQGQPCLGVVVHNGKPQLESYSLISKESEFICYIPISDLMLPHNVISAINRIWEQYIDTYETLTFPPVLKNLLISITEESLGPIGTHFVLRCSNLLLLSANLSWIDVVSARWRILTPYIEQLSPVIVEKNHNLSFFKTSIRLIHLETPADFISMAYSPIPITSKICSAIDFLERSRQSENLEQVIKQISSNNHPGAPFLVFQIARLRENILAIAADAKTFFGTPTKIGA